MMRNLAGTFLLLCLPLVAACSGAQKAVPQASSSPTPTPVATGFALGGCSIFSADYAYNQDISQAPLDSNSASYIATLNANAPTIGLDYPGIEIYNIVPASQPMVTLAQGSTLDGFNSSDTFSLSLSPAAVPIPTGVQYENMGVANADHHLMILQQGTCRLFEGYTWGATAPTATGWGFIQWDLSGSNAQIPDALEIGSTTAAGTPLLPGVIWPEEIAAGEINHAIDIVMPGNAISKCNYVHPASSGEWDATGGGTFPYGGRLRLKANYDMSGYTGTQALIVLRALQKYGMINTDDSGETVSTFRLGGIGSNQGWVESDIMQLTRLTWDDFEVVSLGTVYTMAGCQ